MEKIIDLEFSEWIGKSDFRMVDIYSKYIREPYPSREIHPDYDTFVESRWSIFDEIPEIMADNDNTELDWCLENSYTTDELYEIYLYIK